MNINPYETLKFIFEAKGAFTQTAYQGTFEIKPVLNLMEIIGLNNYKRNLLNHPMNNETIDEESSGIAYLLAKFKSYIIKGPSWFYDSENLKNCYDFNIPILLNEKIEEEIKKWMDKITEEAEKAKKVLING